jgi:hypothetical protein
MKKTFVIQVEYPDNDVIPSEEVMEVTQECIENYLERYFGANIMDGDYDRIKVNEVTDGFSLVKRMREAQITYWDSINISKPDRPLPTSIVYLVKAQDLEKEVDEYLSKMGK